MKSFETRMHDSDCPGGTSSPVFGPALLLLQNEFGGPPSGL